MIRFEDALKRRRICNELTQQFESIDIEGLERCAIRLYHSLPNKDKLDRNTVLVPYGGGKDSSFVAVVARLIQLLVYREYQDTFALRFVTNLQAGMAYGVLPNIDRVYKVLGIYSDPLCEAILVDGTVIIPFDSNHKFSETLMEENRTDVLLNGHLSGASNRATFCNACNFSMVRSFALSLAYKDGADLVITGDSLREQRAYSVAVERMARDMDIERDVTAAGFGRFLHNLDQITIKYNTEVHGEDDQVAQRRIIHKPVVKTPEFFSLFEELNYEAGHHWDLLVNYLGFEFHDLAFSFTESDCANPALMAHLRGLRAEHLWFGRTYHEGVLEYCDFAIQLMRRKQIPEQLIRVMEERYSDPQAIVKVRQRVEAYALDVFGVNTEQLVCMVFSPFASSADGLARYLEQHQPNFSFCETELLEVLRDRSQTPALIEQLESWSGLGIDKLRHIYRSPLVNNYAPDSSDSHPISLMFSKDPHRSVIATKYAVDGPVIQETESGR